MSTWRDLKREAKQSIHDCFALCALYTPPGAGASPVVVQVRHHTRVARFGDLDREGYAQVAEDVNRMVFLQGQVKPERRGIVSFDDGRQFRIEMVEPPTNDVEVACDVVPIGLTTQP